MRDGLQHIHQLALVFVDALDLHVEQSVRIDHHPGFMPDPAGNRLFVQSLGSGEFALKARVGHMRFQQAQLVQIIDPGLADGAGYQPGQRSVAHLQPAAWRDTIGLVDDPPGMQCVQFREQVLLDKVGMQRRNPVDLVRHHKSQLAHPHFVMLDDADIVRPGRIGGLVPAINAFNNLHVARQNRAHHIG